MCLAFLCSAHESRRNNMPSEQKVVTCAKAAQGAWIELLQRLSFDERPSGHEHSLNADTLNGKLLLCLPLMSHSISTIKDFVPISKHNAKKIQDRTRYNPSWLLAAAKHDRKKNSIYPQGKATQCHSSFATVKKNVKSKNIPCVERANLRTTKRSFNEPNNLRWGHGSDMIWVFGGAHETNDSPECNTNSRRLVCWPLVEAAMALDSLPLCC